jgi:hypothetical protein
VKRIPEHVVVALKKNNLTVSDVLLGTTGKGHIEIVLPNRRKVHCSLTPSCQFASKHLAGDIKRKLRE